MLYLTRSASNTVVLRVTDLVTLDTPYFLFEFKHVETGTLKYFIAANTSDYTYNYDKFVITEVASGAESLTTGSVNLAHDGQWEYRIWEQASSTNLNPHNTTTLLRTGIAKVEETLSTINKYSSTPLTRGQYNIPV